MGRQGGGNDTGASAGKGDAKEKHNIAVFGCIFPLVLVKGITGQILLFVNVVICRRLGHLIFMNKRATKHFNLLGLFNGRRSQKKKHSVYFADKGGL